MAAYDKGAGFRGHSVAWQLRPWLQFLSPALLDGAFFWSLGFILIKKVM